MIFLFKPFSQMLLPFEMVLKFYVDNVYSKCIRSKHINVHAQSTFSYQISQIRAKKLPQILNMYVLGHHIIGDFSL